MIVIISDHDDQSTNEVIDWLYHFKAPFIRLNENDKIKDYTMLLSDQGVTCTLATRDEAVWEGHTAHTWYRRGGFNLVDYTIPPMEGFTRRDRNSLQNQLDLEHQCTTEALGRTIFKEAINSPFDNKLNKVVVLALAQKIGLKIPATLITNRRSIAQGFRKEHGAVITKNISQGVYARVAGATYGGLTTICTAAYLRSLPVRFPNALFQPLIAKWLDLRVFYLDGRIFASAIFSQVDKRTRVDFRNYNEERPNRTPPFRFDSAVENMLCALMTTLGLRSGSIDMILTPQGDYVFLEVNPVGQFKQVSYPCNYKIEKLIAETLIHGYNQD